MSNDQAEAFRTQWQKFKPKDFSREDKLREKGRNIIENKNKDKANNKKPAHTDAEVKELIKGLRVCLGCYRQMFRENQRR